ncbi:hypothetical protein RclHR1_06600007 [Rhizophagus clarus]|uniref:Uncharacterized protein n=1 Tax=Rhizophagus clarus TaxID=94130 RepID=A0A2Z6RYP3_9GLOM|nr:hypothetical protein RclHR1_06600007 [Rhizophagus clarus]
MVIDNTHFQEDQIQGDLGDQEVEVKDREVEDERIERIEYQGVENQRAERVEDQEVVNQRVEDQGVVNQRVEDQGVVNQRVVRIAQLDEKVLKILLKIYIYIYVYIYQFPLPILPRGINDIRKGKKPLTIFCVYCMVLCSILEYLDISNKKYSEKRLLASILFSKESKATLEHLLNYVLHYRKIGLI